MSQLAYTRDYQLKLLSYMFMDPSFGSIAAGALTAEHFSDRVLQWFFDQLSGERQHTKVTLKEELIKASKTGGIREEEVKAYVDVFKLLQAPPTPDEQEHMKETLGKFIRTQNVKTAIVDSVDLMNEGRWDDIETIVSKAVASGVEVMNRGQDYFLDLEKRLDRRKNKEQDRYLPTGIPPLDMILSGGLKQKQVGLIVGGTGRGKSVFLEWLASVGIFWKKKIIYFTLELPEDDISERFDSMFCRVKPGELLTYNNEVFQKLDCYRSDYGSSLIIKEFPPDEVSVSHLKSFYRQLSSMGFQADLVIIDYLDLLKPHRTYNDAYQEMDATVKAVCGFAKSMNTRVWTASQLNRSGLVMETPDESSIAGGISKLYNVDVAIFMAQTKEEREIETMRLVVSKNRNGPAGKSIELETDYTYFTFYRPPPVVSTPKDSADDSNPPAAPPEEGS